MCGDIAPTVVQLEAKGVEFTRRVRGEGFGPMTAMMVPGGDELGCTSRGTRARWPWVGDEHEAEDRL